MDLKEKIWKMTEQFLPNPSIFIVDIKVSAKNTSHIRVILDGDEGVSIDQCAAISRKLGHQLEEEDVISHAYNLEVSSPGVDYPLQQLRQYKSRIGRKIEFLLLNEAKPIKGELLEVKDEELVVAKETKVKKKVETEEVTIAYNQIEEAKVLISFR